MRADSRYIFNNSGYHRYSVGYWMMVTLVILPLFFVPVKINLTTENFSVLITFGLIGLYAVGALFRALYQNPYTINCAHWIFVFFFFFWMPLIQFLKNGFPAQADAGAVPHFLFATNGFILFWCFFYSLTYQLVFAAVAKQHRQHEKKDKTDRLYNVNRGMLLLLSIVSALLLLRFLGLSGMLIRSESEEALAENAVAFGPLESVCRSIPIAVFTYLFIAWRNHRCSRSVVIFSFLLMSFCNFPTALGRFWIGALAIGIICLLLHKRKGSALWLMLTFCLGFAVFMPALGFLRYSSNPLDLIAYQQGDIFDIATGGDFDAYEMLANTLQYCQSHDVLMGNQLFGSAFFFIPRSLWPNKPISSGTFIANQTHLGLVFSNLSEPLPAEGYLDFGPIGLVGYAIILAALLAYADHKYWRDVYNAHSGPSSALTLSYPYLIGFTISLMRGALFPVYAQLFGFLVSSWIVVRLGQKRFDFSILAPENKNKKIAEA